jgi:hypothetical protein
MDALKRLEQNGYVFTAEGDRLTYRYESPNGQPMSAAPQAVQEVVGEWAAPLLAEVRDDRAAVLKQLRARLEWASVWDDWCAASEMHRRNPLLDDEASMLADLRFINRLNELAIDARWPFYNGGPVDQGEAGWLRLGTQVMREALGYALSDGPGTTAEPDRGGSLVPCYLPEANVTVNSSQAKESDTMGIKIEQTKFEVLPTGEYRARIVDISQVEGRFGPQLQLKMAVSDGPHSETEFLSWCNPVFSPKSRLFQWVEAALAVPVPPDYDLDTDDLLGREVLATVIVKQATDGAEVNRVEQVRAVRGAARRAAAR